MGCCFTKPSPPVSEEPIIKQIIPDSKPLQVKKDEEDGHKKNTLCELIPPKVIMKEEEAFVKKTNEGESTVLDKSIPRRNGSIPRRQKSGAVPASSKRGNPSPGRVRSGSEIGENSGRRSRSPAVRGVGRSSSGRRVASPAGKVEGCVSGPGVANRSPSGPVSRRFSSSVGDESYKKSIKGVEIVGCGGEERQAAETESLDNPVVSLECFIFL